MSGTDKKTKILFLAHSFVRWKGDFAGAFLLELASGLQKQRLEIFVVTPHEQGLSSFEKIEGVPTYRFQYASPKLERIAYKGNMHELVLQNFLNKIVFIKYMFSCFLKTLAMAGKEKVDIIHAHWWVPSGIIALLVSKISGKPYIITSHGSDVFMMKKLKILIPLAKMVFKEATFITVVSSEMRLFLVNSIGIPADKIEVFPMPCDFSIFYPMDESRGTHLPVREEKIILSVGRLIALKGYAYLINAIALLKKKGCNIKLIIIGGGPEENNLKKLIEEKDLEDCIEILGFKPKAELNYYYNLCDVFVLPSIIDSTGRQEGFGLVLLEAMSCKKPVIGTSTGGIKDIIKDGETGLVVPEKNPQALADAIEKLLENKELVNKLSENGYSFVRNNFTVSKIADKMIEVYKSGFICN